MSRLGDYCWSSYRAYKAVHADWLHKDLILSQFSGLGPGKAYREKEDIQNRDVLLNLLRGRPE